METSIQAVDMEAGSTAQTAVAGPLALWHLLSLDAPTVAAVWTWFVAHSLHIALPAIVPAAMFLAVWLLYAADRLMDTMRGDGDLEALEERHRFHRDYRRAFKIAMAAAALALVPAMAIIPAALLHRYAWLGVLLLSWFGLIHLWPGISRHSLPKELIPGPFFSAAVFIPCLVERRAALLLAAFGFGLVCVLNCMYIFAWEHPGTGTPAHATTRAGVRVLTPLALLCVAGPLGSLPLFPELAPVWIAIAGAAALLFGLDRTRRRLGRTNLRAAADLVLLTPLLVAPFLR